jgi:hypothetical protein
MNDVITLGQINNLKKTRDKKTLLLLIHVLNFFYSKGLSVNFLYTKKKKAKIPLPKNVSFVYFFRVFFWLCNYSLIHGKTDNASKQVYNDLYGT